MTLEEAQKECYAATCEVMNSPEYVLRHDLCSEEEIVEILQMRARAYRLFAKALRRVYDHAVILDTPPAEVQEVS